MSVIAWATAGEPLAGQTSSGDRAVVVPFPEGALVALIDGLGHGTEAAAAAEAAEQVLLAAPYDPITDLVKRCHDELRRTRGVVITLASFDAQRAAMTWLGVGNVDALLVRVQSISAEAVPHRGGTVGYMLPPLNPRTLMVHAGDTLVLATDGIRQGYKAEVVPSRTPQEIADQVMAKWAKPTDDACVVVARYVGEPGKTKITIEDEHDVARARMRSRDIASGMGFETPAIEAIATAVSELARNIFDHAERGEIVLTAGERGLEVVARDQGPGIADVQQAMQDGFSTRGGLGCGLPGARRLVDELEIASVPGVGTVVRIHKWL